VLLAQVLLGERLTSAAALRIVVGTAGAAIVLWPDGVDGVSRSADLVDLLPLPRSLADWLGIVGGFSFALNNVMLRREASRPKEGRSLAMFAGGALVAGTIAAVLGPGGAVPSVPAPAASWLALVGLLTIVFLAGNLSLQYGAARLPANRTAVVMLTEVLFASLSAVALGGGTLTARLALGGALIVSGAVLAALEPGR
jgi:drug/metabolite transporter (DMT)-like permease